MHAYGSLIKNLLRTFFKFTSSFVVQLLLFGHRGCAVLRLSPGWHVSRRCITHLRLLPIRGVVGLLRHATLVKSLSVVILLGGLELPLSGWDSAGKMQLLGTYLCVLVILLVALVLAVVSSSCGGGSSVLLTSWLLSDNVEYTVFKGLLVLAQPVLLPGVVVNVAIEVVPPHAVDEETFASSVVRLLFEFERSTVFHELSEF